MKKKVIGLVIVLGLSSSYSNAQGLIAKLKEKISIGVKAEGNYSNFILSDMNNTKSTMGIGGSVGTSIKFDISRNFAIQEDIMFTYASSGLKQDGIEDTYNYFGTEVPIYLMGQWNTPVMGRFYVGVGPYFSMGFSAKLKDSDINLYKKVDGSRPMTRLTTGAAAQIGYEFPCRLQINASYKIGLTNSLDSEKDNYKMRAQSVSLGIGYCF